MSELSINEMRNFIKSFYPTPSWCYKVDHMKNNQVYAIYKKFIMDEKIKKENDEQYHQMTIFEVFGKIY